MPGPCAYWAESLTLPGGHTRKGVSHDVPLLKFVAFAGGLWQRLAASTPSGETDKTLSFKG